MMKAAIEMAGVAFSAFLFCLIVLFLTCATNAGAFDIALWDEDLREGAAFGVLMSGLISGIMGLGFRAGM